MGALCRLQKRRSKQYPACSDVEGAVKIDIFPLQENVAAQRRPQAVTQRSGCGLEVRSSRMSAR